MEWEMATAQERGRRRKQAAELGVSIATVEAEAVGVEPLEASMEDGKQEAGEEQQGCDCCIPCQVDAAVATVAANGRILPIEADIHKLAMREDRSVVQQICDLAGIEMEDILLVWASPPCESYTSLDYTNSSRGNQYRDHESTTREPRSVESCVTEEDFKKRRKAMEHDQMAEGLVRSFTQDNYRKRNYSYCLENPMGMLAERPFMHVSEWLSLGVRRVVNYCNYGGRFLKPTLVWTSLRLWVPGGQSGTGRCGENCGAGSWKWVPPSQRKAGVGYSHDEQIGGPTSKTKSGFGPKKHQRWHVPAPLLEEVLSVALEEAKAEPRRRYVIDLCAGRGSWLEVVQQKGLSYIPVDIDISAFTQVVSAVNN
jgi:hypothetical protein